MADKKIIALIQARMGSTRLPGKVLLDIGGQSMLERVVRRVRRVSCLQQAVIVTTEEPADDAIVRLCEARGFPVFRGSEQDVLDRYYQAAVSFQADVIVRITSDCPLIDPAVVEKVIGAYLSGGKDLMGSTNAVVRTYPRGLDTEVVSFSALEAAWRGADKPYQREHVMPYVYENPALFKLAHVKHERDLSLWRWTVDETRDLEFIRKVYELMLTRHQKDFGLLEISALIDQFPELANINAGVEQKRSV